jgi:beta-1,4-mannosyltransferase
MTARGLQAADLSGTRGENPYVRLLYENLAAFGIRLVPDARFRLAWLWAARRDVTFLHFHWGTDRYYVWRRTERRQARLLSWTRLAVFAARLAGARLLGYRVVWTIHEIYPPHSRVGRRLDRLAAKLLARFCDVLLTHDRATAARARDELGRVADRIEVVPHASYAGVYPRGRPASAVRSELGISPEAFVFLCFGKVRRDKAIDALLTAVAALPNPSAVLVVAGHVEDEALGRRIAAAAASDPRIRMLPGFVAPERVVELFDAADAAVFARSEVWTSGSLILALSLGLPVVAAAVPPYDELIGPEAAGWLFAPGDTTSLRAALERAASDSARTRDRRAAALERAAHLPSWRDMAERTAALMLAAAGGRWPG